MCGRRKWDIFQPVLLFCLLTLLGAQASADGTATILQAEAFIDDASIAPGDGTPLTLQSNSIEAMAQEAKGSLDTSELDPGFHVLYFRFQDDLGVWSETAALGVAVYPATPAYNVVNAMEAFVDADPGRGHATALAESSGGSFDSAAEYGRGLVSLSNFSSGTHALHYRVKDSSGEWSDVVSQTIAVALSPTRNLVSHYYGNILDREPDQAGGDFWDGEITRLRTLNVESKEAFIVMAVYFFNSAEYLARNTDNATFIGHLYRTFFNREADQGGRDYWQSQIAAGMPRDIVMFNFLFSAEFSNFMAASLVDDPSRAEVLAVIDFYRGILNRIPETEGLNSGIGQFRDAQCVGNQTLQAVKDKANEISWAFLNSGEYTGRARTNAQYVSDLYNAFMRRGGDLGGVSHWIGQLDSGAMTRGQLREVFLDSPEFNGRIEAIVDAGCLN